MAKVLFVKANNRAAEQAVSVQLYDAFLAAYKASNPQDEVTELDLFAANLPYYDASRINAMFKAGRGMELAAEEVTIVEEVNGYLNQFIEADKVVFAFPLWNFTIPAVLHTYFDYLCQAGKTFRYTAEGPVGLLSDKKVALLNARGGVYSEGPAASVEMAVNLVTNLLGFYGIRNVSKVIVEGHNASPDRAAEIVGEGLKQAKELAQNF
ncbi:FMN-dependent NADH-azoreductase [Paenibacillus phyllosphaerae]|uniref:FMN dependent NADH:quinone oxidoreductase n=1 Tax=Paenibacillus phyllosphaerae TaxID=274593 RepID=A0A7W5FL38_9BACL|nr:FMN-dependent NADH-azoreductase [Paenibacillus phyllosphaerae]MBB3108805.1 FMN-dependent NADH-azoreductase [Paenibacillus phyllosphaerae]